MRVVMIPPIAPIKIPIGTAASFTSELATRNPSPKKMAKAATRMIAKTKANFALEIG